MSTKIKTNSEVIKAFLLGYKKGSANHLKIEERNGRTALINYSTVLAEIMNDGSALHFNRTNYSSSTTRIQNELLRSAERIGIKIVYHMNIDKNSQILV